MDLFRFTPGDSPVLVSVPHAGLFVPDDIKAGLSAAALALPDTDWHVDRLYDFVTELGCGLLTATHSRYVVDLNRDPEGKPLYPGADNTETCPTATFHSQPIYREAAPDQAEVSTRIERYWRPYHEKLAVELKTLKARHGMAVLFDAHSIASVLPRFFQGSLPVFNLGTANGASADAALTRRMMEVLEAAGPHYTSVLNGRFTGGYITRRFGRPADAVHAVQLEMAQRAYMDEAPPYRYREDLAQRLRPVLRNLIETVLDWARRR